MGLRHHNLVRYGDGQWRIEPHGDMGVPAIILGSDDIVEQLPAEVFPQLEAVASLPGIIDAVYAMPDLEPGDGFPVGVVAAFGEDTIVCSTAVGADIACGIRLLRGQSALERVLACRQGLADDLYRAIPDGIRERGRLYLTSDQLNGMLQGGAPWAVDRGMGWLQDLRYMEDGGQLAGADPATLRQILGRDRQVNLGTLGSGCHFVEVLQVTELFESSGRPDLPLSVGEVLVAIHSGSCGVGQQVSAVFQPRMIAASGPRGATANIAWAPVDSPLGQEYLGAMRAAANCAHANRQVLSHMIREVFDDSTGAELEVLCDVAHNSFRSESHPEVEYEEAGSLMVHRRGVTCCGDPSRAGRNPRHQLLLPIAGRPGGPSYLVVRGDGLPSAFGSAPRGSGRLVSRERARSMWDGKMIGAELERRGIEVRVPSPGLLAEEAPGAYKDIESVVDAAEVAGLVRRVARMEPLIIIRR